MTREFLRRTILFGYSSFGFILIFRLEGSSDESKLSFLNSWVNNHIQDAQNNLQKPLLFAEFGKSSKDSGFDPNQRDAVFNTVYSAIYSSARGGGAAAGGLFWQLLGEGMDSLSDGYEIVLSESSSTVGLINQQSQKLNNIRKMYAHLRNVEIWKRARDTQRGGDARHWYLTKWWSKMKLAMWDEVCEVYVRFKLNAILEMIFLFIQKNRLKSSCNTLIYVKTSLLYTYTQTMSLVINRSHYQKTKNTKKQSKKTFIY